MKRGKLLEEEVLDFLEEGPRRTTDIIETLALTCAVTRQGVYKALRKLKKEEKVTVHKKMVSLSLVWLGQELVRLSKVAKLYQSPGRGNFFLALNAGEQVTFRFRTLQELDLFWVQAFLQIIPSLQKKEPVYTAGPHDWFAYARPSTDTAWIVAAERGSHPQRMVITHPAPLDKKVLAYRQRSRSSRIETCFGENPFHQSERKYFNIAGSWVFEAVLDERIAETLNSWIKRQRCLPLSGEEEKELERILHMTGKHHLKISHAPQRSEKLQMKLEKFFVFRSRKGE